MSRTKDTNGQKHNSSYLIRTAVAAVLGTTLVAPTALWAQTAEATLRGVAPANAPIVARNVKTGATRRTTADADGSYVLVGLPPGTYHVEAGPGKEQDVTLSVATTQYLDLTGAAVEEVTIVGRRLVEVRTSEVGAIVRPRDIETVPQVTRNFLEFADTVPGMAFNIDSAGNTSIQSGAMSNSSTNLYIDGIGRKNYVSKGGITGQTSPQGSAGDPGNPFPQLAIGEYKVITSNYKAEFDQVSSALITAASKSGTNTFSGEVFGTYYNQGWQKKTPAEEAARTPKAKSSNEEYGFAVGGPIIMDKLHYFAAWEHKALSEANVVAPPAWLTVAQAAALLPPGAAQYGPVTNPFKEDLLFAKLDYEPSSVDRFDLSTSLRRESSISGSSGQTAQSAAINFKNQDNRADLKWQHSAETWLNEASFAYENTIVLPTSSGGLIGQQYIYAASPHAGDLIINVNGQGPNPYTDRHQSGWSIKDDFSLPNIKWHGDHTFKMGAKYKKANLTDQDIGLQAMYWYAVDPVNGVAAQPFQAQYGQLRNGFQPAAKADATMLGIYFQDDWVVNKHWTVNLGVRWDYETMPTYTDWVTPQAVLDAFNRDYNYSLNQADPTVALLGKTYKQVLKEGGVNLDDYISTGHNRSVPKGNIAPRLGFSYDINEDQKHVVFGGYGRSYDREVFQRAARESLKAALTEPTVGFYDGGYSYNQCFTAADAQGSAGAGNARCIAWDPSYATPGGLQNLSTAATYGEVQMMNNHFKTPYSDQFSLGIRNKLGDWNTSATIVAINSYNNLVGWLGNRCADSSYYCPVPWGGVAQWGSQGPPGIGGNLVLNDNSKGTRTRQLLLSADKPYTKESGWGLTIAYTFTDARQPDFQGTDNDYLFDLPNPSNYQLLPSSNVAKHRLVTAGSLDGPWGIIVGAKFTLETPKPQLNIYGCPTVCNPWGGQVQYVGQNLPGTFGYREVDLQATKNFAFSGGMSIYTRFDVLNVFNSANYDQSANANWSNFPTGGVFLNKSGPTVGVPLTIKLSAGLKW